MKNKIDSQNISIIVQGPIDNENTPKCVESIRAHLPNAQIILSTWEGSEVANLDYDELLLNKDPGAVMMSEFEPNNIKRQIASTLNGIKLSDRKYVLKLRADIKLTNTNFLSYYNRFECYDDKWKFVENRILVSSIATRDPFKWECPFCISDWVGFGLKEDMLKLWDIPYPTYEESNWFNLHCRDLMVIHKYPALISRFNPEQYIIIKFAEKFLKHIPVRHMFDNNEEAQKYSANILANNFIVLNPEQYGFAFLKKTRAGADRWHILTHNKWLKFYNKYANGNASIPLIDWTQISYLKHFYRAKKRLLKHFIRRLKIRKLKGSKYLYQCPKENSSDEMNHEILMNVVIPCHGRADVLRQTLESILNQTSKNFSLIITDDTKTKEEREEIESLCKEMLSGKIRYEYVFSEPELGQVVNTNQGLAKATAKYIRILHSDDILHPLAIEYELYLFSKYANKISCLYHRNEAFKENMPRFKVGTIKKTFRKYERIVAKELHSETAVPSAIAFSKEAFDKVGYMNPEYKRACDWDFFYRFVKYAKQNGEKVLRIKQMFIGYRTHFDNNTNNSSTAFLNFFDYKKISSGIINDMKDFNFSKKSVDRFAGLAAKYRYRRLLTEIKNMDESNRDKYKDIIWEAISSDDDLEYVIKM